VCGFLCDTGYHVCSGACVSNLAITSCGATSCATCATRPNSTPTCDGTKCGYKCNTGFADCNGVADDGCEANLGDPLHCGTCTDACPVPTNGTATCSSGTCGITCNAPFVKLGDRCAIFAGASETNDLSCSPGTTTGVCLDKNPFAGGCGCPVGFKEQTDNVINDCSPTMPRALVRVCEAGADPGAKGDWQGFYAQRLVSCAPACQSPNVYTSACTCPAGATPISFTVLDSPPECSVLTGGPTPGPALEVGVLNSTIETSLTFCKGAGPAVTFFGAYGLADDGTCLVKDPTNGCACPIGSVPYAIRVFFSNGAGKPGTPGSINYCVPG
jgi:hypothetical protein